MIEYKKGNLLEIEADALVNTVNTVGAMGKGIALQFKKAFPEMAKAYESACNQKSVCIGKMHVWKNSLICPRFIINFPTKEHWRGDSKIEFISEGLKDLIRVVRENNIRSIAIPPLGCGLGGLLWEDVQREIHKYFESIPDIKVFLFPPQSAPEPMKIINNTSPVVLTPTLANIILIISEYFTLDYELRLIEVHKLLYFYQIAGEPLKLRFKKEKYGPFADNLRHVMNRIEGHYLSGIGDGTTKPFTQIKLLPNVIETVKDYLKQTGGQDIESRERANRVLRLIHGFESPYGMELLASVHWVATDNTNCVPAKTLDEVIQQIQAWNKQKKQKMSPNHIETARNRLIEEKWLEDS
ncbi:MAG: macro domain-containing protein [Planctomycetaceae bacterium]|jgi:O-acetyl-ADP-ribose deacetylase (regulator of RNase III)|nr:macro domain-containing protein [Planctomycetaceae bacterium]